MCGKKAVGIAAIIILAIIVALTACSHPHKSPKSAGPAYVGTWRYCDHDGEITRLVINDDRTGIMSREGYLDWRPDGVGGIRLFKSAGSNLGPAIHSARQGETKNELVLDPGLKTEKVFTRVKT